MLKLNKTVSINLLILLVINIIELFMARDYVLLFIVPLFLVVQVVVNLLIAIINLIRKDYNGAKSFFLSAVLVALIGFSACVAQFQMTTRR